MKKILLTLILFAGVVCGADFVVATRLADNVADFKHTVPLATYPDIQSWLINSNLTDFSSYKANSPVPVQSPCITFDGVSDFAETGTPLLSATGDWDLSFRFRWTEGSYSSEFIVSQLVGPPAQNWGVFINGSGGNAITMSIATESIVGSTIVRDTDYQVRVRKVSGDYQMWLDGVSQGTLDATSPDISQGEGFSFGGSPTKPDKFEGSIWDFTYDEGDTGDDKVLWTFTELDGTKIYDVSGDYVALTITAPSGLSDFWTSNTQDDQHWAFEHGWDDCVLTDYSTYIVLPHTSTGGLLPLPPEVFLRGGTHSDSKEWVHNSAPTSLSWRDGNDYSDVDITVSGGESATLSYLEERSGKPAWTDGEIEPYSVTIPNADFELGTAGGIPTSWKRWGSVGGASNTDPNCWAERLATGGNPASCVRLNLNTPQTYVVLFPDPNVSTTIQSGGETIRVECDIKYVGSNDGGGGAVAGIKVEPTGGGSQQEVLFTVTDTWATYGFDYSANENMTAFKTTLTVKDVTSTGEFLFDNPSWVGGEAFSAEWDGANWICKDVTGEDETWTFATGSGTFPPNGVDSGDGDQGADPVQLSYNNLWTYDGEWRIASHSVLTNDAEYNATFTATYDIEEIYFED